MVHLLCTCSLPLWCIEIATCDTNVPLQIESAALQSLVSPASCLPGTKKTANNHHKETKKRYCRIIIQGQQNFMRNVKALSLSTLVQLVGHACK